MDDFLIRTATVYAWVTYVVGSCQSGSRGVLVAPIVINPLAGMRLTNYCSFVRAVGYHTEFLEGIPENLYSLLV